MKCVNLCPGLAIFGYNLEKDKLFLPIEYSVPENAEVFLVDNDGKKLGTGTVEKILTKSNKTNIARIKSSDLHGDELTAVRGFILKDQYPDQIEFVDHEKFIESEKYICHCDDVKLDEIVDVIGDRKFISIDEIKHTTRLGMGACRGKRCIARLKQTLASMGIGLVGRATPRAPLSNQLSLGELYPRTAHEEVITNLNAKPFNTVKVKTFIAGGGIAGSALFRYLAEESLNPVMVNYGRGASWRNIAGGRPNFSVPELSEIASQNHEIFKHLQLIKNIDYREINYVTFAHDRQTYDALESSKEWSDAEMIEPKDFRRYISPFINPNLETYISALVTHNCWQATPGKVVDLIRTIGVEKGGTILEDCELIDVERDGEKYKILIQDHTKRYIEYHADHFINALGPEGDKFARRLGYETGIYSVKHQAFITRRLPMIGVKDTPMPMMIDRRRYKGFTAVYGQQLAETGQIIGCASPAVEPAQTDKTLKTNTRDFLEIASEVFVNWIPELSSVGFQAVWAGYYVEPKMVIDPEHGLFIGLRGQGYMLGQYLAKLYVDKLLNKPTPDYFERLKLTGDGLLEKAFK